MTTIVNVADICNPETGLTFREENMRVQHKHMEGDLVEFIDDYSSPVVKRCHLYVYKHTRDCDGTPLYTLSLKHPEEIKRSIKVLEELSEGKIKEGSFWCDYLVGHAVIDGISEHNIKPYAP